MFEPSETSTVGGNSFRLPFIFSLWHSPAHEPARPSNRSLPWESGAEDARTPNADAWTADSAGGAKRLECVRFIGAFRLARDGSWPQCTISESSRLSMNLRVLPASCRQRDRRKALLARCRQHLDGVLSPIGGYGCCVAVISTSMKHLIDSLTSQAYRSSQPPLMALIGSSKRC